VAVDDLYGAVALAGPDGLLGEDGVHFTVAGYAFLGGIVADALRPLL
jgi:lysophospholipase L1-like esterase